MVLRLFSFFYFFRPGVVTQTVLCDSPTNLTGVPPATTPKPRLPNTSIRVVNQDNQNLNQHQTITDEKIDGQELAQVSSFLSIFEYIFYYCHSCLSARN